MLSDLIKQAIELKEGNKEFALFHADGEWLAEIGNPSGHVMLGEVGGEIGSSWQPTPEKAVEQIIAALLLDDVRRIDSNAVRAALDATPHPWRYSVWSKDGEHPDAHCVAWECHLAANNLAAKRLKHP